MTHFEEAVRRALETAPEPPAVSALAHRVRRRRQTRAVVAGVAVLAALGIAVAIASSATAKNRVQVVVTPTTTAVSDSTTSTPVTTTSQSTAPATKPAPGTAPTAAPPASGPTAPPHGPALVGGTATPPATAPSTNPQASDFAGAVTISPTSIVAGGTVMVTLTIRNITDHVVDPSSASNPDGVALVCAPDLTPDGHTNEPLVYDNPHADNSFWFVTNPPLGPGVTGGSGGWWWSPTTPGIVTCEGVLITSLDHYQTIVTVTRLTNIPPVTLTITSPTTTTT